VRARPPLPRPSPGMVEGAEAKGREEVSSPGGIARAPGVLDGPRAPAPSGGRDLPPEAASWTYTASWTPGDWGTDPGRGPRWEAEFIEGFYNPAGVTPRSACCRRRSSKGGGPKTRPPSPGVQPSTKAGKSSCRRRHPDIYGDLTMSARINGPCRASERTLGLGDVKGLRGLYRPW
jgi:hypothetical protein